MADMVVRALSRRATRAVATIGTLRLPCALGRHGITVNKREGDGATPAGRWRVGAVLYRSDRPTPLHRAGRLGCATPLRPSDGWCDASGDRNYNRAVTHPYPASAERLWRDDHLYDVIVVLDYNRSRRVQGQGSAIFMHLARLDAQGMVPTAGCVALRHRDLALVLRRLTVGSSVHVVL